MKRRGRVWGVMLSGTAALCGLSGNASAQPRSADPPARSRPATTDPSGGALLRRLVEPGKQDEGPLKPGEEKELLQFADQHLPQISAALKELHDRKPDAFNKKLEQVAPRMRFLKRLFATRPQIAAKIAKFADNRVELERLRQQHAAALPEKQRPIEQQMRTRLADNLGLEQDLLAYRLDEIQTKPLESAENEVRALLDGESDAAAEPQNIRDLVRTARSGTSEARTRLGEIMRERMDSQADSLRARIQRLRDARGEMVDEQMRGLLGSERSKP